MKFIAAHDLDVKDRVATNLGYLMVNNLCSEIFDRENFEVTVKFLQRYPACSSWKVYEYLIAENDNDPLLAEMFFCESDRKQTGWREPDVKKLLKLVLRDIPYHLYEYLKPFMVYLNSITEPTESELHFINFMLCDLFNHLTIDYVEIGINERDRYTQLAEEMLMSVPFPKNY